MDSLDYYQIIKDILEEYAKLPYSHGNLQRKLAIAEDHQNYVLLTVGEDRGRRVHCCIVHLEVVGDKIWIHEDGLEDGIAEDLLRSGIPKEKIVLGFHPPEVRPHTGFAVG